MATLTQLVDKLQLVNNQVGKKVNLIGAVAAPPVMALTIDGASTLEVVVADHDRKLITSDVIDDRSWAVADGVHFELVGLSKSADHVTLTFEDAIVAELRRHTKQRSFKAGKFSRAQIAAWLAKEARVPVKIDPSHKAKIKNPIQRSASGQKTDTWEVLGSEVAEPINWRRFSDGSALIVGGDDWLTDRYKKPVAIRENTGGIGTINFDLDVAKRASTATTTIDTRLGNFRPGAPVRISQLGPADGLWIVSDITHRLTSHRADLTLTRKTHVLKEPKKTGGSKSNDKDSGAKHSLPGQGGDKGTSTASNSAREKMVKFALSQSGKPYTWGASGPGSYDCSGLVQAATRHAGKTLGKPSASQWSACQRAGRTITVKQALGIRGALLFRIGGEYNHVAISLGNGSTVEARGSAYGCGVFGNAAGQGWTGAALWL